MSNTAFVGWYLVFSLVCLCVLVVDNWDAGVDLTASKLFVFVVMSVFPIMNIIESISSIVDIVERRTPMVLLKGKK